MDECDVMWMSVMWVGGCDVDGCDVGGCDRLMSPFGSVCSRGFWAISSDPLQTLRKENVHCKQSH